MNRQGEVIARCRISDRVRQGVAWMPFGGWGDADGNPKSVNTLTPEEPTDWGGGSGFYDAFVRIEKLPDDSMEIALHCRNRDEGFAALDPSVNSRKIPSTRLAGRQAGGERVQTSDESIRGPRKSGE